MLGREHSGKVSKKFIGNFYFWGITLSKRPFQGDAVVKSAKARDVLSRRSRAKFNSPVLHDGVLHSQILAYLILSSLLWHVLKSFVRFLFSCYNASLIYDEDYIILYELFSSRNPDKFCLQKQSFRLGWNERRWMQGRIWSKKMPYLWNILYLLQK